MLTKCCIIVIICVRTVCCTEMTVTWDMATKPVTFGNSANLTCNIIGNTESCLTKYLQWYGGRNYTLLCRSGTCRNKDKYVEFKESHCSFTLQIGDFSLTDVNVEYTCLYKSIQNRKMLDLNNNTFRYIPKKQEITMTKNDSTDGTVRMEFEVAKVYPIPICSFMKNNSKNIDVIPHAEGVFYKLMVNISYSIEKCHELLQIECQIGNSTISLLNETVSYCDDKNKQGTNDTLNVALTAGVSIGIVVGVLITISFLYFIFTERRKNCTKYVRTERMWHGKQPSISNTQTGCATESFLE